MEQQQQQQQVKLSCRRPVAATEQPQGAEMEAPPPLQQKPQVRRSRRRAAAVTEHGADMELPPEQQVAPLKKPVKRIKKTADHYTVILALPAWFPPKEMEPRAEGKKTVATEENTSSGPSRKNKKQKAASEPKDAPKKGRPRASGKKKVATDENITGGPSSKSKNHKAACAPNDAPTEGDLGIMQANNIQNAIEDAPEDPAVVADIFHFALNNQLIDLPKIDGILEEPTGVEPEQNVNNNERYILDQQAGVVQQQNPAENAIEVAPEDEPVFGDIFDFPLNNQLVDLD